MGGVVAGAGGQPDVVGKNRLRQPDDGALVFLGDVGVHVVRRGDGDREAVDSFELELLEIARDIDRAAVDLQAQALHARLVARSQRDAQRAVLEILGRLGGRRYPVGAADEHDDVQRQRARNVWLVVFVEREDDAGGVRGAGVHRGERYLA